jgi:CSLREA domain-containing protein
MFEKRRSTSAALGGALLIAATCGVVVSPSIASAATHTFRVNTAQDTHDAHPGTGACADSSGHCSLRAAIEETNAEATGSNITVRVPANKYKLSLGTLAVTRNTIDIVGSGSVVLKATSAFEIMNVGSAAHATISDVKMKGGNAGTGEGGGLNNSGTTTLTSVTISRSTAAQGGGIYNKAGATLSLDDSTVSDNTAADSPANSHPGGSGGGILNAGTLVLDGSTVSGNYAGRGGFGGTDPAGSGGNGGGIENTGALTAGGSTISGNVAGSGGIGLAGNEASGPGGDGGGIYSPHGASVTLTESTVESNTSGSGGPEGESPYPSAGDGGGIWSSGMLTVTGSSFLSNTGGLGNAGSGNGGAIFTSGTAIISSSTFTGDTAGPPSSFVGDGGPGGNGGAIDNGGTLTLSNSTLTNDAAGVGGASSNGGSGGGLYSSAGSATLSGDTFSGDAGGNGGNSFFVDPGCTAPGVGGSGGGIYSTATLSLTDSTLSGNTDGQGGFHVAPCAGQAPNGFGAGIATAGGAATVSYSTLADNTVGIDNLGGGTITLGGTIVADNPGGNCSGTISETSGYNLDSDATCGFTAGTDINSLDPQLQPLANNGGPTETQAIDAGSPAIDSGGTPEQGCPATDQRGLPRPDESPDNGICDIGAYESQGVS